MGKTSFSFDIPIFSHPGKLLIEHLEGVWKVASSFAPSFLTKEEIDLLKIITYLHDLGKSTPFFQEYLNANKEDSNLLKNDPKTRHSLVSAVFTFFTAKVLFPNKPWYPILSFVAVKSHHGDLIKPIEAFTIEDKQTLDIQIEAISKEFGELLYKRAKFPVLFEEIYKVARNWETEFCRIRSFLRKYERKKEENPKHFFLLNTLFSLLIDADKLEAGVGKLYFNKVILDKDLVDSYRRIKGWENPKDEINIMRNEIYERALSFVDKLNTPAILSLNVPTGLGKTLTSFSLALKLKEKFNLSRIIYSLPFLSIIEQNHGVIEEVWKTVTGNNPSTDVLLKYHHMSELIYTPSTKEEFEPDEEQLLVEGWNSEIVVTTFIQVFHTLIGYKNRMLKKFNKILNSVIILDEIQSIPFKYWVLMEEVLDYLVKEEHCFIIFTTATKPMMVKGDIELVEEPSKYFSSVNRYKVMLNLKKQKISDILPKEISDAISSYNSVLVVLNTISAAKLAYDSLPYVEGAKYFYLSTHVTPYERLKRIEEIKKYKGKKIVISTQLVEAGVDIDLDVVIRDIAPLDSIQQAAGRCNRNGYKEKGIVKVLNLCTKKGRKFASYIYDPLLLEVTLESFPDYQFEEKDFYEIVQYYYKTVKERLHQEKGVLESIYTLNYNEGVDAISTFKLIEDEEKIDIFIELNEEAASIWKKYGEIKSIKDRWERKREYNKIKRDFHKYIISVYPNQAMDNLPPEEYGLRYVPNTMLKEYYDLQTGFITDSESSLW